MRISDWSSDVCSSDLGVLLGGGQLQGRIRGMKGSVRLDCRRQPGKPLDTLVDTRLAYQHRIRQPLQVHDKPAYRVGIVAVACEECQRRRHPVLELRSEERRGGKEGVRTCRSRW